MTTRPADNSNRAEVAQLARDMVMAAITTTGQVPTGEATRQFVREARRFYSEVDNPSQPKKAPAKPSAPRADDEGDDDGAELLLDE